MTASPAGENFLAPLVNMINQSGLSSTYTSGSTDFDTYTATATHDAGTIVNLNYGQSSQNIQNSPILFTFDLGSVVSIDALAYWISDSGVPGIED